MIVPINAVTAEGSSLSANVFADHARGMEEALSCLDDSEMETVRSLLRRVNHAAENSSTVDSSFRRDEQATGEKVNSATASQIYATMHLPVKNKWTPASSTSRCQRSSSLSERDWYILRGRCQRANREGRYAVLVLEVADKVPIITRDKAKRAKPDP